MKVRIKQAPDNWWRVEIWRWWWPFWTYSPATSTQTFDAAKAIADRIKNPTILEVQ